MKLPSEPGSRFSTAIAESNERELSQSGTESSSLPNAAVSYQPLNARYRFISPDNDASQTSAISPFGLLPGISGQESE